MRINPFMAVSKFAGVMYAWLEKRAQKDPGAITQNADGFF